MTDDRWRRGLDRREFLRATGLGLGATALAAARAGAAVAARPKVAAVVTELRYRDHANVILENFLEPYFFNGERTDSGFEVAGLYVDQTGKDDMVRDVAKKYSIAVYPTIAGALCLGASDWRWMGCCRSPSRATTRSTPRVSASTPASGSSTRSLMSSSGVGGWCRCSTTSTCRTAGTGPGRCMTPPGA